MKTILTAVGNSMLNKKISQMEDYNVLTKDISNDEELIEWLERCKNIDVLFLHSNIIKHYKIDEFIKIIRKLQENIIIIFFPDKNAKINIKEDEHLKIYTNLEMDWKVLEDILKKTIKKDNEKCNSKIITISGASGVGKSTFCTFFAKNVQNTKTLLIDFDLDENQIRTILKIKKQPKFIDDIKSLIINVDKNLDVLCHLDTVFSNKEEINFIKIQEMFNQLKEEYNSIIIDTSSKLENEYTKRIFYNSDDVIFLLEPNILGVKKSKNMLEVFENDWKLDSSKIKLVLNKTNIYQISEAILEELFPNMKLLGSIKYKDCYNLMINKNINKREIKKEYEKIYKRIYTNFK